SEQNLGHLAALPDEAIVEKRAVVDAFGVRAAPLLRAPPAHLAERLRAAQRFEELAAECAREPGEAAALAALLAHPFGIERATAQALVPLVLGAALPARVALDSSGVRA